MDKLTFAQRFLRIYDKKILNGEITFSGSGIKKNHFTRLCIDPEFVIPREDLEFICDKMNITGKEREALLAYTNEE